MKAIVVPTDFSAHAFTATEFACELANKTKAKLWVINVFTPPVTKKNVISGLVQEEIGRAEAESKARLEVIAKTVRDQFPGVACETAFFVGNLVEIVTNVVEEANADLVVMGTKGARGLDKVLFGSNTTHVMEKVKRPVLAVPAGTEFSTPTRIIYATDFNNSELTHITHLVEIAKAFESHILMTHIVTDSENSISEEMLRRKFSKEIEALTDYPHISYYTRFDSHVADALEEFAQRVDADWMSILSHDRKFFEKIYNPSIAKKLAFQSKLPLLALKN